MVVWADVVPCRRSNTRVQGVRPISARRSYLGRVDPNQPAPFMPITQLQLARRLRAARKTCHITQAKAASALGIPRSAVSQMETGQRGVSGLMEVRANAFAASFLMPADGVRRYVNALSKGLGSRTRADTFDEKAATRVEVRLPAETQNLEMHDVVRMAHHFGVSCAAMLYRLKGLGFVTEEERSSLAEQDGAGLGKALRGFLGLPEADDSDGEMRVHARFVAMAIEAFTRAKITERKLDELGSLVQVSDLRQRLWRAGLETECGPVHEGVR